VAGISVAGMDMAAPGMSTEGVPETYEVQAFNADGTSHIYAKK
jgi:hypothetical protein